MTENFIEQAYSALSENVYYRWALCMGLAIVAAIVIKTILAFIAKNLRKLAARTHTRWDDIGVEVVESLRGSVIFIVAFFLMTRALEQSSSLHKTLLTITVIALVYQFIVWGLYVISKWRELFLEKRVEKNPSSASAIGLIYTGTQIVFISLAILIGLSNVGVDITALLAGLGVGGIAVALAAQNVLGDLLASLSIVFDKPFVIGDFIVAGTEKGTVEYIGIKTTRLRALSGEQLVLSNKDLLESRVQNFKRMQVRRVVQSFGVVYSTPPDILERIPEWVKEIVQKSPQLKFDRCHFHAYGASSLDFELVFFVSSAEYNIYMDLQQGVLLDIYRKFTAEKVDFAFPTQTVYVEKLPTQTN